MVIEEFFRSPREFSPPQLPSGRASTIEEFYQKCILVGTPESMRESVVYWHNLLTEYIRSDDAILPIRLYENLGPRSDYEGISNGTRRRALTIHDDNFAYVFASNSFARSLFSMVIAGLKPSVRELNDRMKRFASCLGFHWGTKSLDEPRIAAYPIKYKRKFYLDGWYLAHISGVGDTPYNGCGDIDIEMDVFPKGRVSDWRPGVVFGVRDKPLRSLKNNLSVRQKNLARAACLRFIDPLNYFLVPSQKNERHKPPLSRLVGEDRAIVHYMHCKRFEEYGEVYRDFCSQALVERDYESALGGDNRIEITFGSGLRAHSDKPSSSTSPSSLTASAGR